MKYVLLPLISNGAPCLINIDTIATAYEDKTRDEKRGLKIHTTDGDYTFVDYKLHELLKDINRFESYEEEYSNVSDIASIDKGTGTIVGGGPDE